MKKRKLSSSSLFFFILSILICLWCPSIPKFLESVTLFCTYFNHHLKYVFYFQVILAHREAVMSFFPSSMFGKKFIFIFSLFTISFLPHFNLSVVLLLFLFYKFLFIFTWMKAFNEMPPHHIVVNHLIIYNNNE